MPPHTAAEVVNLELGAWIAILQICWDSHMRKGLLAYDRYPERRGSTGVTMRWQKRWLSEE
jgi:hypothetical protein